LLGTFRALKIHVKKAKKAKAKYDLTKATILNSSMPVYSLDHIIKERYPSFVDALRDLDDPLCLLGLYASLGSHKEFGVLRERVLGSSEMVRHFMLYVIKAKALRKVFVSVKGVYM
jgi:pescadillo protein